MSLDLRNFQVHGRQVLATFGTSGYSLLCRVDASLVPGFCCEETAVGANENTTAAMVVVEISP